MQKDTPAARQKVAPLPAGFVTISGTFPRFSMPDAFCGCGLVRRKGKQDGLGIEPEALATLQHFLSQPSIKRVDTGWHWESDGPRDRPAAEEKLTLEQFRTRNESLQLAPDMCYRITDPTKFI